MCVCVCVWGGNSIPFVRSGPKHFHIFSSLKGICEILYVISLKGKRSVIEVKGQNSETKAGHEKNKWVPMNNNILRRSVYLKLLIYISQDQIIL